MYLRIPTQSILVLGSAQAAFDLLEKRSDLYSGRTQRIVYNTCVPDVTDFMQQLFIFYFLLRMSPRRWNLGLMTYGSQWRSYRREFHQYFNQHVVSNYQPIQLHQCRAFLRRALDDPSHLSQHIRLYVI